MAVVSREVERASLAREASNAGGILVFSIQRAGFRLTVKRQDGMTFPPRIIDGQNIRSHATMFTVFNQVGDVCGMLEGHVSTEDGKPYYGVSHADNFKKGDPRYSGIMKDTMIGLLQHGIVNAVDSGFILSLDGRATCESIEAASLQPNSGFSTTRFPREEYGDDVVQFVFTRTS